MLINPFSFIAFIVSDICSIQGLKETKLAPFFKTFLQCLIAIHGLGRSMNIPSHNLCEGLTKSLSSNSKPFATTSRCVTVTLLSSFSTLNICCNFSALSLLNSKVYKCPCENIDDILVDKHPLPVPLSYITDGQRVPEDLSVPVSRTLAVKALSAVENDVAKIALDKEA